MIRTSIIRIINTIFKIVINLAGEKRINREFLVFVLSYFIIRMIAIGAFLYLFLCAWNIYKYNFNSSLCFFFFFINFIEV